MKDGKETDQLAYRRLGSKPEEPFPLESRALRYHKQLPLPSTIRSSKELKGAIVVPQKSGKLFFEQKYCIPNQKYPLIYLEALKNRSLTKAGVKERWVATRNLRNLSLEIQQWIYAQLHQRVSLLNKDHSEFHSLIERREERHYQVDRIIKYLSHF